MDVFTKMEFKLHQNEPDFTQILLGLKAYEEKTSNHLFFYQNFGNLIHKICHRLIPTWGYKPSLTTKPSLIIQV